MFHLPVEISSVIVGGIIAISGSLIAFVIQTLSQNIKTTRKKQEDSLKKIYGPLYMIEIRLFRLDYHHGFSIEEPTIKELMNLVEKNYHYLSEDSQTLYTNYLASFADEEYFSRKYGGDFTKYKPTGYQENLEKFFSKVLEEHKILTKHTSPKIK